MLRPIAVADDTITHDFAHDPTGLICIVGDPDALTAAIERQWRNHGCPVRRFDWPSEPGDVCENLSGLILVAPNENRDITRQAFRWIQAAGSGLRKAAKPGASTGQGRHIQMAVLAALTRLGGRFGCKDGSANAATAGLAGLIKSARHEWPAVACRVIDVAEDAQSIEKAALESTRPGPIETGLSLAGRCELQLQAVAQQPTAMVHRLNPGDLVVISGGAKGVTNMAALALAQAYRPTLLLLGRSALPQAEPNWLRSCSTENEIKKAIIANVGRPMTPKQVGDECQRILGDREITVNLQRLRSTGATVEYQTVDIRNPAEVDRVLADARRRHGPVRGLVHGAGVLADRKIDDKTLDQFDRVYQTKVDGLKALLCATSNDDLEFIALYSSSTARFGRIGQCDYAAANEVLNATARQLRHERPSCRVVSFNWGPWEGGMVTPALQALFESEGVGLIPLEAGGQFLVNELNAADGATDVVVLGPPPANYTLELTPPTHPWLTDHQLNGQPVLPLAVMIEAFLQSVPSADRAGIVLQQLRVRRPIIMKHADHLRLQVAVDASPQTLTLENGEPVTRPTVTARWSDKKPTTTSVRRLDQLVAFPITVDEAYSQVLFHGPAFQCITAIDGVSPRGIRILSQSSPRHWRWWKELAAADRITDPLVIDAALQAIILWAWAERGQLSLPIGFGQFVVHVPHFPAGECDIEVTITSAKAHMFQAHVGIFDDVGKLLVEMVDCEYVATPDMSRAFGKSTPTSVGAN